MKEDFYQRITDQIVSSLEQGVRRPNWPPSSSSSAGSACSDSSELLLYSQR